MRVVIIGGAGYIGTRLSNYLCDKGYDVTVIDEFWFGDFLNKKVNKINKNLWKIKTEELKGFDCLLFLAGLSNDPMAMFRPDLNFIENSAAPSYLAFLAKDLGIKRFICSSSCSVYGFTDNKILDEDSRVKPSYAYGISKLQCERGLLAMESDSFRPILFRKGTVGGWSQKMRYDLVVNTMIKSGLSTGKITVNNPDLWRPLIDIRDVIQGYELAINSDLSITGVYNLSGGNYTIGDLGKIISTDLSKRGYDVELVLNNVQDLRNYKVSTEKIEKYLKYKSKYTPVDSISEIFDNINFDNYQFDNEIYYNIDTFKKILNND